MDLKQYLSEYEDYAIQLRREFHSHPELSSEENWTSKRICTELNTLGISYHKVAKTGVVGIIHGNSSGKCIGIRADIDALPIEEKTNLPYASQIPGVMHACGHDGHIAALLLVARILSENCQDFSGTVKLIFQPAEETGKGARAMVKERADDGLDAAIAIHLWNDLPLGKISVEEGPRFAASSQFRLKIIGKGGHGSAPHETIDATVAAAATIMNLQTLVSREMSPNKAVVLTIGLLNSGTSFTNVSNEANMLGVIRFKDASLSQPIEEKVKRIAFATAETFGAKAELIYTKSMIPVVNAPILSKLADKAISKLWGESAVVPYESGLATEDFAFFGEKVPIWYGYVGCRSKPFEESFPHHSPYFNFDEHAIVFAAGSLAQIALDFLKK